MSVKTENAKKLDLTDINYKRAAINIAANIVSKIEEISTRDLLIKELDSAVYSFTELVRNYQEECKKEDKQ